MGKIKEINKEQLTEDKTQSRKGKELINTEYKIIANKKDKYNYKLSQEDKEAIILEHFIDNSKANVMGICNKYNISESYVYKLIREYKSKNLYDKVVDKCVAESKKKFSKTVDTIISKALNRINEDLNNKDKDIDINKLGTTIGILYDKNALETGKATSNQEIHINVKID